MEGFSMPKQELQRPGENSTKEEVLLGEKLRKEKLLEQIKNLKQGDEITVRTEHSNWVDALGGYEDKEVHYLNMIFDSFDQNEEGVSFTAHYRIESHGKEVFSTGRDGLDKVDVFPGFDAKKDYLV